MIWLFLAVSTFCLSSSLDLGKEKCQVAQKTIEPEVRPKRPELCRKTPETSSKKIVYPGNSETIEMYNEGPTHGKLPSIRIFKSGCQNGERSCMKKCLRESGTSNLQTYLCRKNQCYCVNKRLLTDVIVTRSITGNSVIYSYPMGDDVRRIPSNERKATCKSLCKAILDSDQFTCDEDGVCTCDIVSNQDLTEWSSAEPNLKKGPVLCSPGVCVNGPEYCFVFCDKHFGQALLKYDCKDEKDCYCIHDDFVNNYEQDKYTLSYYLGPNMKCGPQVEEKERCLYICEKYVPKSSIRVTDEGSYCEITSFTSDEEGEMLSPASFQVYVIPKPSQGNEFGETEKNGGRNRKRGTRKSFEKYRPQSNRGEGYRNTYGYSSPSWNKNQYQVLQKVSPFASNSKGTLNSGAYNTPKEERQGYENQPGPSRKSGQYNTQEEETQGYESQSGPSRKSGQHVKPNQETKDNEYQPGSSRKSGQYNVQNQETKDNEYQPWSSRKSGQYIIQNQEMKDNEYQPGSSRKYGQYNTPNQERQGHKNQSGSSRKPAQYHSHKKESQGSERSSGPKSTHKEAPYGGKNSHHKKSTYVVGSHRHKPGGYSQGKKQSSSPSGSSRGSGGSSGGSGFSGRLHYVENICKNDGSGKNPEEACRKACIKTFPSQSGFKATFCCKSGHCYCQINKPIETPRDCPHGYPCQQRVKISKNACNLMASGDTEACAKCCSNEFQSDNHECQNDGFCYCIITVKEDY